jgi:hypothetical protein
MQTAAPITFDSQASSLGPPFSLDGIFGVTIWVSPIADVNIGSLLLQSVSISGTVKQASIQNVSVPVDVRRINLKTINIGQIYVNNITL